MKRFRVALGIRAQLLLVLTVFLVIPWLGYEYVRELERFLRDAQEATLAGTAQAVATALHDRPRLFDVPAAQLASLATERQGDAAAAGQSESPPSRGVAGVANPAAPTEIAQIIRGLSRTTARIWVIDRDLNVLARAGSLKRTNLPETEAPRSMVPRFWRVLEQETLHPLYALVLKQPSEDFTEELSGRVLLRAKEVDGALSGILTTDRRPTPDGKAVIVSAAHPIWVGDSVKGAVIVEETTNAVLAERNRAFERLFNIVLAALLIGSVALTLYASRLSARIRKLRDEAEAAIDAHGRVRSSVAGSDAGDEIGDLSRSFSSALARLSQYASYQENIASRLSHELRTPIAVVRSSLDNLRMDPLPEGARVYMERAQQGLNRLTHILTRMTEATRLEQSLRDAERERFDLTRVVAGCIDGYRVAYPRQTFDVELAQSGLRIDGAPELVAQMLDKLIANAVEFSAAGGPPPSDGDEAEVSRVGGVCAPPRSHPRPADGAPALRSGTPIIVRLERDGAVARLSIDNEGPALPEQMRGRLFDSMVSVRSDSGGEEPHLGLGLYIVRLIAEFHRGTAWAENRSDGKGVVVTVIVPVA